MRRFTCICTAVDSSTIPQVAMDKLDVAVQIAVHLDFLDLVHWAKCGSYTQVVRTLVFWERLILAVKTATGKTITIKSASNSRLVALQKAYRQFIAYTIECKFRINGRARCFSVIAERESAADAFFAAKTFLVAVAPHLVCFNTTCKHRDQPVPYAFDSREVLQGSNAGYMAGHLNAAGIRTFSLSVMGNNHRDFVVKPPSEEWLTWFIYGIRVLLNPSCNPALEVGGAAIKLTTLDLDTANAQMLKRTIRITCTDKLAAVGVRVKVLQLDLRGSIVAKEVNPCWINYNFSVATVVNTVRQKALPTWTGEEPPAQLVVKRLSGGGLMDEKTRLVFRLREPGQVPLVIGKLPIGVLESMANIVPITDVERDQAIASGLPLEMFR